MNERFDFGGKDLGLFYIVHDAQSYFYERKHLKTVIC